MIDLMTAEQKENYDNLVGFFELIQRVPWDLGTLARYQAASDVVKEMLPAMYKTPVGEEFSIANFISDRFPGVDVQSCYGIIYPLVSNMFDIELRDHEDRILEGKGPIQDPDKFKVFRDGVEVSPDDVFIFTKRNQLFSTHGCL